MVGRRRYEGDPGEGVTGGRYYLVDLESHELSALAGLGPLGALDLQLLRVDEILRIDPEPSRSDLPDGGTDVPSTYWHIAGRVFSALTAVALRTQTVRGLRHGLVGLPADGPERHGLDDEPLHDLRLGFHLFQGHRSALLRLHEVADEEQTVAQIGLLGECLVLRGVGGGRMQESDRFRGPCVPFPSGAICVDSEVGQFLRLPGKHGHMTGDYLLAEFRHPYAAHVGHCA